MWVPYGMMSSLLCSRLGKAESWLPSFLLQCDPSSEYSLGLPAFCYSASLTFWKNISTYVAKCPQVMEVLCGMFYVICDSE